MPSIEVIRRIQEEAFAQDVEIDEHAMANWSEEQVRDHFARGGQLEDGGRATSAKAWLDAMDTPEEPLEPVPLPGTPAGREGDDEDDDLFRPSGDSMQTSSGGSTQPEEARRFMRPSDYKDSEGSAEPPRRQTYLPGVHASAVPDADEAEEAKKREPPPELPKGFAASGVMTVDEAYELLGVAPAERGKLEKLKVRFRKMCLRWHPDKNRGREKQAAEAFQAVHAAYHFLTT